MSVGCWGQGPKERTSSAAKSSKDRAQHSNPPNHFTHLQCFPLKLGVCRCRNWLCSPLLPPFLASRGLQSDVYASILRLHCSLLLSCQRGSKNIISGHIEREKVCVKVGTPMPHDCDHMEETTLPSHAWRRDFSRSLS